MRTFIGAMVLVVASSCAQQEQAKSAAAASSSSPNVDEIVASNVEARGGLQKIQAINSIRESATMSGPAGRMAHVVREIKRPGLFRLEFAFQGTTSVFANDGTTGWQVAPLQGQFDPQVMPPERDAAGGPDQRDIEGPLVDWKQKGHNVTLAGREKVGDKDTFKLKVDLKGGGVRYDYVDVASRQVVRSDITRIIKGHATVLENRFSDFRPVNGLVFPHAIETQVKNRPEVLKIAVKSVELDPALDDARFKMPQ